MIKNSIIIQEVTHEQLDDYFKRIFHEINEIKLNFQPKEPSEFLTREEVVKMLKCDQSTLHNWTVKGKLTKHCLGNRVYYKRSEIEAAIIAIGK